VAALALAVAAGVSAAPLAPPVVPAVPAAAAGGLEGLDLEELMKIEVVVAASKRAQATREVPSFVSVVTAAQIRAHGFRTLADVLRTLPGFYASNDRNYSFVGVRGFQRAGDYNSRILLLLNGLRTNDNVYDAAAIGEEFGVDLDLVERIEVIRGPSAAIYGSNAFFAVVNLVTRPGSSFHGGEAALSAASFGTFAGRATWGRAFATGADVLLSASVSDSTGRRLYFPEYDDPSTNDGISDGADRESFRKLLATVTKGGFFFQASNASREKGVPTGSFETIFNDPRSQTIDGLSLASLTWERPSADGASVSARVHGGRWTYAGVFPYAPDLLASEDGAIGEWWGLDVDASRALSRHFVTVGAELRDNYRQDQKTYDLEPAFIYTDVHHHSRRYGLFAQDEIRLAAPLMLSAGLRFDHYPSFGSMITPRVGLVYNPGPATTLKLLAGRAFRAPNEFELHYESSSYAPNPGLEPERIETLEIVGERLIGDGFQVRLSAFDNRLNALISQRTDPADGRVIFVNADQIHSRGAEVTVAVNHGHGPAGEISYTLQRTEDRTTHVELTNSPRHLANVRVVAPLHAAFIAALDAQYVSGRGTLAGANAPGYVVTNISLLAHDLWKRVGVTATVYNVFDAAYGVPTGDELRQDVLPQDGRSVRVKTTIRF
jgi:iron complex outermembrane receptor protein